MFPHFVKKYFERSPKMKWFLGSLLVLPLLFLLFLLDKHKVHGCDKGILQHYTFNLLDAGSTPEWYTDAQEVAGVLGQDGGNAVPLAGGYTWMIYGDTVPRQGPWRSNSGLLVQTDNGTVITASYVIGEDGLVAQLIPFVGNETMSTTALWGGAGIYALNTTWIFYQASPRSGNDPSTSGISYASGTGSNFTRQDFNPLLAQFAPSQLIVGNGTNTSDPSTYLYMYTLTAEFLEFYVHIARVPLGALVDASSFHTKIEWYTGHDILGKPTWKFLSQNASEAMKSAATIAKGVGAQITAFWNDYLQSYTLLLAPEFSNKIEMATSATPWGPWSCNELLFEAPLPNNNTDFVYCPYLQPQLSDSPQVVSLIYSVGGVNGILSPYFAEVSLSPK